MFIALYLWQPKLETPQVFIQKNRYVNCDMFILRNTAQHWKRTNYWYAQVCINQVKAARHKRDHIIWSIYIMFKNKHDESKMIQTGLWLGQDIRVHCDMLKMCSMNVFIYKSSLCCILRICTLTCISNTPVF